MGNTYLSISPFHNAVVARCVETIEEEQAVSTDNAGPCMANTKHIRPAAQLKVLPVAMYRCALPQNSNTKVF